MFTRTNAPATPTLTEDDLLGLVQRMRDEDNPWGPGLWQEAGALWMRRYGYHIACTCGRTGHRPCKPKCLRERAQHAAMRDLRRQLDANTWYDERIDTYLPRDEALPYGRGWIAPAE